MSLVDSSDTDPPWQLWADVREVVGPVSFDTATRHWLPELAAQALAGAGEARNSGPLLDGLWRLELERDALLAKLGAEGVSPEFPLTRSQAPVHWRALQSYWLESFPESERRHQQHQAAFLRWGGLPPRQLDDLREARLYLESNRLVGVNFTFQPGWILIASQDVNGEDAGIRLQRDELLLSVDPDELDADSFDDLLWILDLGELPEGFNLHKLQQALSRNLRRLENEGAGFERLGRARLQVERVRRLQEQKSSAGP
ncbi:MAG: hypothetical protein ACYS26_09510 [Planctomycetota bacterium]|jgi:hypothetical protein